MPRSVENERLQNCRKKSGDALGPDITHKSRCRRSIGLMFFAEKASLSSTRSAGVFSSFCRKSISGAAPGRRARRSATRGRGDNRAPSDCMGEPGVVQFVLSTTHSCKDEIPRHNAGRELHLEGGGRAGSERVHLRTEHGLFTRSGVERGYGALVAVIGVP